MQGEADRAWDFRKVGNGRTAFGHPAGVGTFGYSTTGGRVQIYFELEQFDSSVGHDLAYHHERREQGSGSDEDTVNRAPGDKFGQLVKSRSKSFYNCDQFVRLEITCLAPCPRFHGGGQVDRLDRQRTKMMLVLPAVRGSRRTLVCGLSGAAGIVRVLVREVPSGRPQCLGRCCR